MLRSKFKTYRVTLYPNIRNINDKYYNLTSELIFNKKNINDLEKIAIKELLKIGVIKKNHIKESISQELGNGIPVASMKI